MNNFFKILLEAEDTMKVDAEKVETDSGDTTDNFDDNIETNNEEHTDTEEQPKDDTNNKDDNNDTDTQDDNDVEAEADEDGEPVTDEDQPDDFDSNVDADGDGNTDSEQNQDDNTEQEDKGNNTRNYNLLCDFNNLFNVVKNTMQRLDAIQKPNLFESQVISQCVKNLGTIKESMTNYINFNFASNDYSKNLYMYNYYFQALKIVVNMIKTLNSHTLDKTNK
jgi:hypothetical protein|nr:MAG TPA: hypothetical protein [Caudoviricetes sp.]